MLHEQTNHKLFVMVPRDVPTSSVKESTPVREYCERHGIPYTHPDSVIKLVRSDLDKILNNCHGSNSSNSSSSSNKNTSNHVFDHFDIGVAVSFRYFIPKSILTEFSVASLNVHPSLLPQYRGPAPIHHALLNGDSETGISIIELNPEKFDTGQILYQERTSIEPDETFDSLYDRLGKRGAELLRYVIENIETCKANAMSQTDVKTEGPIVHATKITPDMKFVDWKENTASQIYNKWRALKTVRATFLDTDYLFVEMHMRPTQNKEIIYQMMHSTDIMVPGSYVYDREMQSLYIKSKDNTWIGCTALQQPGKRVFTAQEFNHQQLVKQINRERQELNKSK
jgi:methionyl-tRNA formyltransferase